MLRQNGGFRERCEIIRFIFRREDKLFYLRNYGSLGEDSSSYMAICESPSTIEHKEISVSLCRLHGGPYLLQYRLMSDK